jgi:hypothetical protein
VHLTGGTKAKAQNYATGTDVTGTHATGKPTTRKRQILSEQSHLPATRSGSFETTVNFDSVTTTTNQNQKTPPVRSAVASNATSTGEASEVGRFLQFITNSQSEFATRVASKGAILSNTDLNLFISFLQVILKMNTK